MYGLVIKRPFKFEDQSTNTQLAQGTCASKDGTIRRNISTLLEICNLTTVGNKTRNTFHTYGGRQQDL